LLFLIAAARDAFLILNAHWTMLHLPKGLIVVHARVAVVGFVLLSVSYRTDGALADG